jgi:hypothetical protein
MQPPRFVITLGLHGSASTWAFNVVRELMLAAHGEANVHACFAQDLAALMAEAAALGRHVVCKTHGWPGFPLFAQMSRAPVIVTLRDPRDAVLSMVQRFGSPYAQMAHAIAADCQHVAWCAQAGHPVLRYEDAFFDQPATVRRLAAHLGLAVGGADPARIFAAYRTEAVRDFADGIAGLPQARRGGDGAALLFDQVTQVHHKHIGDARCGKWRDLLPQAAQRELSQFFAPFLERFGYPAD